MKPVHSIWPDGTIAGSWGYSAFHVCNLFSFRSTDPKALLEERDAEGDPDNLQVILKAASEADIVVCAWGVHGALRQRESTVLRALADAGLSHKVRCLGRTTAGHPRHPLYLAADTPLIGYGAEGRVA